MNLEMKIHPALAGLVIALTVVAIGTKFWADGAALEYSGPAQLLNDPHGHVYIQIQNQLLEHTADGEYLRRHDLGALGVDTVIGAIAFFSNGDILLRRGEDSRSFGNKFAAYQRRENDSDLLPDSPGAGLARCNLETRHCREFAAPPIDFKSTIGITIDWRSGDVFISDTSRHSVRKYSASGTASAAPVPGFKFPNQLLLADEQLLIADTNHQKIRIVAADSESFGRTIRSIDVVPAEAQRNDHRWPSHLARVGNEWWVNNMSSDMRDGGIYAFDGNWQYQRRIPLPEAADPISILPFSAGALISDWDNDRIHYIAASGETLDDFSSPGLDEVLEESREARRFYRAAGWMGFVLLGAVLIGLLSKALLSPAAKAIRVPATNESAVPMPSDELIWFEPDPKSVRIIRLNLKLAGGALVGLVALLVYMIVAYGNPAIAVQMLAPVGGLILIYAVIYQMSRAATGTAVGFQGNDVILRNHKGAESRRPVSAAVYNNVAIATPDIAVLLGQAPMPLYPGDVVAQQIMPRLAQAKPIPPVKMQRILFRLLHPRGVVVILTFVGLAAVATLYLLR